MRRVRLGVGRVAAVAAGAFAAVALAGAPAQARTLVTATFTGTISGLLDRDGLLGTVVDTQIASDLAFTDTFVFDLDKGVRFTGMNGPFLIDSIGGGSFFPGSAPLLSSRLTINGATLDFLGTYVADLDTFQGLSITAAAQVFVPDDVWRFNIASIHTNAPALLTGDFSAPASNHTYSDGFASICAKVVTTGNTSSCDDERFSAQFVTDTVTLSTSVPEPATWALMILGFGGVGGLARRRRTARA